MSAATPQDATELREDAARCAASYAAAEQALAQHRAERDTLMRAMFEAGITWAEIGRTFGVTPQAAMYASGMRTRTGRARKDADQLES